MGLKNTSIYKLLQLFNQTFGSYKLQIIGIAVLSFVNSLLEGIGISTLIPIFSFVAKDDVKGADFISRVVENFFNFLHVDFTLKSLLIFIIAIFIIKVITLFLVRYITARVTTNYQTNSQISILKRIVQSDWPHLSKQKLGHLDQILTTNIASVSVLFFCFSTFALVAAKIVIYSVIVFKISVAISLLTFALGLMSFFIFKPWFHRSKNLAKKTESLNRLTSHYTNENVLGMKIVKSMSVEKAILAKASQYFETMKQLNISMIVAAGTTDMFIQIIGIGFVMVIFVFFYKILAFNFAVFMVMIYAVNQVFSQIQNAQMQLHRIIGLSPYVSSIADFENEAEKNKEEDQGAYNFEFHQTLVFSKVGFSYEAGKKVLTDVSFEIKKGEMVGLIGPSGAGKTTVVDLLMRFLRPQTGEITLDGKDIAGFKLKEWRENIGYVSQDMFLMNDTIANNIKFYDETLTEENVTEAARMANIYDFIQDCAGKFSTIIGERGILLSMGQRQRIIIARVLARQPQLLILDEATSALDNESEMQIQKVIENLKGKVTVLAIAHRLSTVINSDRLVVLEGGKIAEIGPPQTLLKHAKSYFSKVYNLRD